MTKLKKQPKSFDPPAAGGDKIVKVQGVDQNLTGRKRAEEALRALSERNEAILQTVPDIIAEVDRNKVYTWVNQAGRQFFGEGVIGQEAAFYFEGEQNTYEKVQPLFEGDPSIVYVESWQRRQDGERRLLAWWCRNLKDANGKVTGAISTARDITERKRAEETINSLAKFPAENPNPVLRVDRDGILLYANEASYTLLRDWRLEVGQPVPAILRAVVADTLTRQAGITLDTEHEQRIISFFVVPVVETGYANLYGRDVTERREAEEALCRRNRELNLLNQVITAAVINPESILEATCRAVADAFEAPQVAVALLNDQRDRATVVAGYTAKDPSQRQNAEMSATLGYVIQVKRNPAMRYLLRQQKPLVINNDEPRLASLRGGLCQEGAVSVLMAPLFHKGQVLGLLCLDDTRPRQFSSEEINVIESVAGQVAAALVRAKASLVQQRLSTAIVQAAECVVITDARGYIVYVNPAFEHVTGYSAGEVLGQNPRILKSGRHDPAFYQNLWSTITAGEVWHGRLINKKKDGALYTEEATISPLKDEQGKIINYVAVKRDITNELQLEKQYRQAQKMQAIGQLTAGIAHNFNNLLTAINGFAELSQARLPADHPLQSMLEAILRSGQSATDLVKQLMIFSRKQMVEPQIVDINAVVAKMDKLLRSIIGEHIALKTTLAAEVWPVKVDPAQFEQVIVNLAVNARDVMPNGGSLTIETANITLDKAYAADHLDVTPGEYVLLAVSDNGLGMTEAVKAHIFEPFFTTKETGKGTGLGLATVFAVVKQSDGHIWVYSELGQGTTFKIYLPRVRAAAEMVIQDDTAVLPVGHETILLVEDNPGVQQVSVAMLREQGYTVLVADNGEQAQRLAQDYGASIDLLVTDVVMPGDNGRVVAEKLRQHWPNLKCLFVSGYTDEVIERHGVLSPGEAFLSKPFTVPILARKVREVLDRP